ncbi:hypothetical protein [Dongia sp.]|uniref:hypothetical protein n=1 Tax=Dongia sp. TaxID=1977262 RepID=UPI0035B1B3E0
MGVQVRQTSRKFDAKGVLATLSGGRQPVVSRAGMQSLAIDTQNVARILQALADLYALIAERLLDRIHDQPRDLRRARKLGRHLDWVGARAQMVESFIKAGDCAMTYVCASPDAHERLLPLVKLARQQLREPGHLSVALYLMERIDEELRLT